MDTNRIQNTNKSINAVEKCRFARKMILEIIYQSKASHIASSFSVVEILATIYDMVDVAKIKSCQQDRDRIVLSKGHSAAALYAILHEYGLINSETLHTYYSNGSLLGGHATHNVSCIEHSTGALGHGLPVAVGMAVGLKSKGYNACVYVVVGDGELHEGSNWEALMLAAQLKLDNLYVFVDYNGLSGIACTSKCCELEPLMEKMSSFGLQACEVDGHDMDAIKQGMQKVAVPGKPRAIICRTIKGKGVSFMENDNVWHYRPPNPEAYEKALQELQQNQSER